MVQEKLSNEMDEQEAHQNLLDNLIVPPDDTNPDGSATQGATEFGNEQSQSEESDFYSKAELEALLESDPLSVEPERVPSELLPVYKAALTYYKRFQADYTRKTQQLASRRAESKPKDIYEAYERDPEGITSYLDQEIIIAKEEGDFDRATSLLALKSSLIEREIKRLKETTQVEKQISDVYNLVRQEIPDIEQKAPLLTEFAIKKLGLSEEEITALTDPSITGPLAAKLTLAVNRAFKLSNMDKMIQRKEVKQNPPKILKPGTSSVGESENMLGSRSSVWKLSKDEFDRLVNKVKFNK